MATKPYRDMTPEQRARHQEHVRAYYARHREQIGARTSTWQREHRQQRNALQQQRRVGARQGARPQHRRIEIELTLKLIARIDAAAGGPGQRTAFIERAIRAALAQSAE